MKLNLLTRTHNRETYFKACRASVESQTYKDINWIVGSDTECPYYPQAIKLFKDYRQPLLIPQGHYHAPYNLYLNQMQELVKDGWIMAIDDDDNFTTPKAVQIIMNAIKSEDDLLIWKVQITPNWIVPSNETFGKYIKAMDFSGIGMCWHSKRKPDWGRISMGDYRAAIQLINSGCKPVWIDRVLTATQRGPHNGK